MHNLSLHRLAAYAAAAFPLASSLPVMATEASTPSTIKPLLIHQPQMLAASFGQTTVPQDKFVAVAVPRDGGYYNLLILEQINSRQQCWREHGTSPTEIEPLLLKFDFTGICGRSTDSNGYSIRQAGKDLGLDYRLTVQRRGNDLLLLGMPNSRRVGQPIELGKTRGLKSGLLKIHLNSGWQFAKRTYQGKTLGHIYLNTNQTLNANQAQPPLFAGPQRLSPPRAKPQASTIAASPARAVEIPVPRLSSSSRSSFRYRVVVAPRGTGQETRIKSIIPGAFRSQYQGSSVMQVGLFNSSAKVKRIVSQLKRHDLRAEVIDNKQSPVSTSSLASRSGDIPFPSAARDSQFKSAARQSSKLYRVVVEPRNSQQNSKIRSLVPDAFRSSHQGKSVLQVGLFDNRSKMDRIVKLMKRNGLKPEILEDGRNRLSLRTVPASVGVLPVPGLRIPLGRADKGSDIYSLRAGLPPAPPPSSVALGPRYRVVISNLNSRQQRKLKGLVPGAFRSSYQGRSVLQVGSFGSMGEARDRMQLIQRHGMNPILEITQ